MSLNSLKTILAASTCVGVTLSAEASGFRILEQSAEQVANANAGAGALTDSAMVIISNPAGMAAMEGSGASINAMALFGNTKFDDGGSASPFFGPYAGPTTLDRNQPAVIPSFAMYKNVSDKIGIGFAGFAPYGNSRDYGNDWVGRYQLTTAEAVSFELNPSVSYDLNDQLAIGAGIGIQYFKAEIGAQVDFGLICALAIDPSTCGAAGIVPQSADGLSTVEGDDWSLGYNLGLLYRPTPRTTIGLSYRSSVEHDLKGTVEFEAPALSSAFDTIGSQPGTQNSDVTGPLELPQIINVSLAHQATENVTLLADLSWQDWSVLDTFTLERSNGAPAIANAFGFED